MRGVITVVIVAVFMVMYMLFAPAAVEGPGEAIKDTGKLDSSEESIIDSLYDSLFKWIPLVVLGGMTVWAVAWYLREQLIIGRV